MRAITLWQPWASQVFDLVDPKDVENRKTLRPPEELWTPVPVSGGRVSWRRPFFAIHAGLRYDPGPEALASGTDPKHLPGAWPFPKGTRVPREEEVPLGAVVGVVRLRHAFDERTRTTVGVDDPPRGIVECKALPLSRWWLGPIGWRLEHAIPIEPVPVRGFLGCWTLPDDVAAEVSRRAARVVDDELVGLAYEGAPGHARHYARRTRMRTIDLVNASLDLGGLERGGPS